MKLSGFDVSFPERVVSNEDVLEMIRRESHGVYDGNIDDALTTAKFFMEHSGVRNRRWLSPKEPPWDHLKKVIERALDRAGLRPQDVQLLIYAGLDKRVAEPGQSFLICKALGMYEVPCFDITEGCMSWSRACWIAETMLESGRLKNVLVVSGEFANHEGEVNYNNYRLEKFADLDWAFPSYTLGEGAAAAVLTHEPSNPWNFWFLNRNQAATLCIMPFRDWEEHNGKFGDIDFRGHGAFRFVAKGKRMRLTSDEPLRLLFEQYRQEKKTPAVVLPHSHTKKHWEDLAEDLKMNVPFHFIYPEYGNLASVSVAAGLHTAMKEDKVRRGDRVFIMMASAGFSMTTYSLEV